MSKNTITIQPITFVKEEDVPWEERFSGKFLRRWLPVIDGATFTKLNEVAKSRGWVTEELEELDRMYREFRARNERRIKETKEVVVATEEEVVS